MKTLSTPNFNKLKKHLTGLACVDLIRIAPEYVHDLIEGIQKGEITSCYLPVSVSKNQQFQKWRSICVDLIDFEYHKHRLHVCLTLLTTEKTSSITKGEWLDHQMSYWAILAQGLISKYEKLFKDVCRKFPTSHSSVSEMNQMLFDLKQYHNSLKIVRDPVAHPGGPLRITGDDENLGPYIIFRGKYNIRSIMKESDDLYFKQIPATIEFTGMILLGIEKASKLLLNLLPKVTALAKG